MNDIPADLFKIAPLKINDFIVVTISGREQAHNYSQYLGDDKIPLVEIVCEDGVFLVLLPSEDYQKLD